MSRKPWIITALVLLLGVVVTARIFASVIFPYFSNAQTPPASGNSVGTHVAFFDSGNVLKVIGLVGEKNGGAQAPLTVNIDVNADAGTANQIISSGSSVGSPLMIRIVGVSQATSAGAAEGIRNTLNSVTIPSGSLVIFGNEVNNLSKEWKLCTEACSERTDEAGRAYGTLFNAFRTGANFTAVPAPLDQYNGDYPSWTGFRDAVEAVAPGAYDGTLVANVYDLGNGGDLQKYTQYGGNVVAFTEYGPHPDSSLQEHLDFFKNNPPSLPATTLIPDKCKSDDPQSDQWLFYIQGKIYDLNGTEINPANCSSTTTQRGTPPAGDYYKRFVYPFYSSNYDSAALLTLLQQSYNVTCANPSNYATQATGNIPEMITQAIARQNAQCDGPPTTACLFSPEAIYSVATGNGLFGVMRNEIEAKWRAYDATINDVTERSFTNRFESVEQWFGANNPPEQIQDYSNDTPDQINGLHQGPFYKLSTLYMQCIAETDVLDRSQELCDTWSALPENTGKPCSLISRQVPGTDKTYEQLRQSLRTVSNTNPQFCENMFNNGGYEPSDAEIQVAKDLSRVDLYMETAYRPAFLVMVTSVSEQPASAQIGADQIYTSNDKITPGQSDLVDFLVYHVPDTLSDLPVDESERYDDIMTKTVNTFTPLRGEEDDFTIEKFKEDWRKDREELKTFTDRAGTGQNQGINCLQENCSEPLRRALSLFINAYAAYSVSKNEDFKCTEFDTSPAESGVKIGSELKPNDVDQAVLDTMKAGDDVNEGSVDLKAIETRGADGEVVGEKEGLSKQQTKIYNVSPIGFRSQYVSDAFDALFTQSQVADAGQFSEDKGYYSVFEALFDDDLNPDSDIQGYTLPGGFDEDGNPIPRQQSVSVEIKTENNNPGGGPSARFKGLAGAFNKSTRAIVQLITLSGQNLMECARAIKDPKRNTEDFLLQCQTRGIAVASPNPNSPNQYTEFSDDFDTFEIEYWDGRPTIFNNPATNCQVPQIVADAAADVESRHGQSSCDPYLLLAIAHSESRCFENHAVSGVGAAGTWQFMPGVWEEAWRPLPWFNHNGFSTFSKTTDEFDCTNTSSADCQRDNIFASADAACRLANATGMLKSGLYENQSEFIKTFLDNPSTQDNPYDDLGSLDRVWNMCSRQGEYVWRLWHALKDPENRDEYKEMRITGLPSCGASVAK